MPIPKSASKNVKSISVYVTGFGPFRNVTVNPSYEIVSRIADTTLTFTTVFDSTQPHPPDVCESFFLTYVVVA